MNKIKSVIQVLDETVAKWWDEGNLTEKDIRKELKAATLQKDKAIEGKCLAIIDSMERQGFIEDNSPKIILPAISKSN